MQRSMQRSMLELKIGQQEGTNLLKYTTSQAEAHYARTDRNFDIVNANVEAVNANVEAVNANVTDARVEIARNNAQAAENLAGATEDRKKIIEMQLSGHQMMVSLTRYMVDHQGGVAQPPAQVPSVFRPTVPVANDETLHCPVCRTTFKTLSGQTRHVKAPIAKCTMGQRISYLRKQGQLTSQEDLLLLDYLDKNKMSNEQISALDALNQNK